ncbi:hypothetical protein [Roseinatronobacter sp.]|uniref:hypothetical protein n=1 Tax=Roseinatronobacter sp. TaxID=1945755 RepID=UPI0025D12D5C|nr:hypothetical protein [Roseibaca sp.]
MTNAINITKTQNGASIKFPFEIKDAFRKAFPSAKWNSSEKTWNVGSRSVKRLEKWAEQVNKSGVLDELAARDEADMSEKEINDLNESLAQIRRQISDTIAAKAIAEKARARSEELRAHLDAAREELEAEKAAAEAEADAVVADVESRVAHIATPAKIEALRTQMRKHWMPKAWAKPHFNKAQQELSKIEDELKKIGVKCQAVSLAACANFNRRDRDFSDLSVFIEFFAA